MEYTQPENRQKIGEAQVREAELILRKYRSGKANLEKRIVESQKWWKLRNASVEAPKGGPGDIKAPSAWLWNVILGKQADAIAAYPTFNCLPREESDKGEAKMLSDIIPMILEQNDYEETYSDASWQKMIEGTAIYGCFWDADKLNGLGDISIRKISALNIFWESGITDIQKSRHVFVTELVDNDALKSRYPQLEGKIGGQDTMVTQYPTDDSVDLSDKSIVVDWYYHTWETGGKKLHYCKFCAGTVLYATENDPQLAERGLYDDGEYPFVFDRLFPVEGSPCGYGYIDIGKAPQEQIDHLNMAIVKNAVMTCTPRFFIRKDGSVNEQEFADWSLPFIHVDGNLGQDTIQPVQVQMLNGNYLNILANKIEELKQTSGNQDVQNGAASGGVTAASAIAALQESAGRSSKAASRSAYRAYARLIRMVIERIRQFYDTPRKFRITGQLGREQFIEYTNSGLQMQALGNLPGGEMAYRKPVFDIRVEAEKANPYTKVSQNELALQFFNQGFFNPQLSDQALAALEMMDFGGREALMQRIAENGTLQQQLAMYQQMALTLAAKYEPQMAEGLAGQIGAGASPAGGSGAAGRAGADGEQESGVLRNARAQAAEAARP